MWNFFDISQFVYVGNQFVHLSKLLILKGLRNL